MPNRRASRNAYYFFVQEKIPELRRRGLPVARVADAIPYCSADWALLKEEEKEKYAEMAREWRAAQGKDSGPSEKQKPVCTPLRKPGMLVPKQNVSPPDLSGLSLKSDQALLGGIFYFLNIFSHGELPPHCEQRFLPCEIGCVKYSLQEGIMADFHSFINPGEIPRGFRFHCQAASDSSHKIPISHFESGHDQATVLENLYRFIHPNPGNWPPIYCKSDDRARVNWCLKHMAKSSEIRQDLELLTVEDLVVGIYQQKFLKEPSKTWVRSLLEVAMWDYSSNTRLTENLKDSSTRNGEGNGTPLQYFCLENPMNGGAWWAPVDGVAKSRARLSDFTFTFHFQALEKEIATHSSVLAWRIPGTREPGGLPSMGSHRIRHD